MKKNYQFYVEGDNEKCLLDVLKRELTLSRSAADYKRDLIKCRNLKARLNCCHFDISRFWSRIPDNKFHVFGNDAKKIKR